MIQAGFGVECITPDRPTWMAGFAARDHHSEGKYQDLWAKALFLDDGDTSLAVVTADLVGYDEHIVAAVREAVQERLGMPSDSVLLNCSHTHCGPVIRDPAITCYPERDEEYLTRLIGKLTAIVEHAANTREQATLTFGVGACTLSVNRRRPAPDGAVMQPYPPGPTDPEVAILEIEAPSAGAILFSYACHPTTMGGYLIGGDYPGFAQAFLEAEFPGKHAMFLSGCHGDLKPRNVGGDGLFRSGPLEVVEGFGRELSQAVLTARALPLEAVEGPLRACSDVLELPLADPPTDEELGEAKSSDSAYLAAWAERLLAAREAGDEWPTTRPLEVQVLQIGDVTIVGLAGEVCVEYALRIKSDLGGRVIVAGYSNALAGYIAPASAFHLGGYEVDRSFIYGPGPAPYRPEIESLIIAKVMELAAQGR